MVDKVEDTENQQEQNEKEKEQTGASVQPQRNWRGQIVGAAIGAFIFMIASGWARQSGWLTGPSDRLWLWGAVIGGLMGSHESLSDAGARLTGKDNKWLNLAVALLGMAIIFTVLYTIIFFLTRLASILNL